jgi:antirestriction protein ArdC
MKNIERAKEALNRLLKMFESGDLPAAVARTLIRPAKVERPSDKWSLGNRLLVRAAGTEDARGFRQWQEVGRRVKKGAKAFYIFAPVTKKKVVKVIDEETGEECEEERTVIIGFRDVPVFRYEDTEGDPLPEPDYRPPKPPPLQDAAKAFGVEEVRYTPANGDGSYGFYTWRGKKRIELHTHDVKTWFHELGHAVHHSFRELQGSQVPEQEIVAEVFAATMCEFFGVQGYHYHAWEYVKAYSSQDPQQALRAVFRVLSDVEECLRRVWEAQDRQERGAAA